MGSSIPGTPLHHLRARKINNEIMIEAQKPLKSSRAKKN
jgi:hypothetical protein